MKVGIIGLGFLGGSLAKSLNNVDFIKNIIAFDISEDSLILAKSDGVIDDYSLSIDEKFTDCDIIFFCVPVGYIMKYAIELDSFVKDSCIFTDVGSTKSKIVEEAKELKHEFIGGHPMVGSERVGYSTSIDLLFENSYYIIAKTDINKKESIKLLESVIKGINALPIVVDSKEHDYITACISHVPQIIASTLVNMVKKLDDKNETMKTLAAGGFKDITRIASSDPTMWEHICLDNSDNIINVLEEFKLILNEYQSNITKENTTYEFIKSSKTYRDSFINRKINGNVLPELNISIKDEVGTIASVVTILSNNNISIRNIEVMNNRENNFGCLRVVFRNNEERDNAFNVLNDSFDLEKIN